MKNIPRIPNCYNTDHDPSPSRRRATPPGRDLRHATHKQKGAQPNRPCSHQRPFHRFVESRRRSTAPDHAGHPDRQPACRCRNQSGAAGHAAAPAGLGRTAGQGIPGDPQPVFGSIRQQANPPARHGLVSLAAVDQTLEHPHAPPSPVSPGPMLPRAIPQTS